MFKNKKFLYILFFVGIFLYYLINIRSNNVFDDYFWHVKFGEWIVENKQVPTTDFVNWTYEGQNHPLIYIEWLVGVIFYLTKDIIQPYWLLAIMIGLIFATLATLIWDDIKDKDIPGTLFLGIITFTSLLSVTLVRPHMFSYIFTIITVKALENIKDDKKSKLYLILPLISMFWANMHGGTVIFSLLFPLGFLICGLFNFDFSKVEKRRESKEHLIKYGALVVSNFLASLINPYFIKVYLCMLTNTESTKRGVLEWQRLSIDSSAVGFISIILIFLFFIFTAKKIDFTDFSMVFSFIILTFMYQRFYSWTALVFVVAFAKYFNNYKDEGFLKFNDTDIKLIFNIWIIVFFIAMVAFCAYGFHKYIFPNPNKDIISKELIDMIKEENPERLFNPYSYGQILIYNDIKTFMNPMADQEDEEDLEVSKNLEGFIDFYESEEKYDFDYYLIGNESCLADYFEHNEDKYELLYKEESPRYLAQVSFYKRLK